MQRIRIDSLPDILCPYNIAGAMGISYAKALKLIKYGKIPFIKVGNTYHVSKSVFLEWLNGKESKIVELD